MIQINDIIKRSSILYPDTTLNIYAHTFQEAQARAMDDIAKCILYRENEK